MYACMHACMQFFPNTLLPAGKDPCRSFGLSAIYPAVVVQACSRSLRWIYPNHNSGYCSLCLPSSQPHLSNHGTFSLPSRSEMFKLLASKAFCLLLSSILISSTDFRRSVASASNKETCAKENEVICYKIARCGIIHLQNECTWIVCRPKPKM